MTNSVIKLVQAIEAEYGMNPNNWPENDVRLKWLHDWYLNHSEKQNRNMPYTEIRKIQKALDEQVPKKTICEIFEISKGKLDSDIERGIFSDVKWKKRQGRQNNELRKDL